MKTPALAYVLKSEDKSLEWRVVGDRRTCFYIQDVIETGIPGQRHWQTIMNRVMKFINENAAVGAVVGLMAAKGKESFYEKYGFCKGLMKTLGPG